MATCFLNVGPTLVDICCMFGGASSYPVSVFLVELSDEF